jgi:hypothetical protein
MRDDEPNSDVPERHALPVPGAHRSRPTRDHIRRKLDVTAPHLFGTAHGAPDRRRASEKERAGSRARPGWLEEAVTRVPSKRPQVEE